MAMIQRRDILDKKDEAEHFWSEHFRKLLEMTAGKSEQETNSILVGLVSSMDRHNEITEGIMYGIMTDKTNALKYFQYLNLVNRDKFSCCIQRLRFLCLDRYAKLTDTARVQLLWFVNRMIDLDVRETDALFNALLRQIVTGDLTPKNIWLIHQMLDMWTNHQSWVLTQPALLPQLLYTILSVMVDHFKPGFEGVKDREVALCLQILKERGNEVKVIGRDLIRLVQQVAYYPEFDDVWRDILTNKQSPLYFPELTKMRTSRLYFQLRSQPEMESLLLFIMKQVKLGNQKRYQQWFQNKYFARVENESILPDVVRFICGCWHPPNQILSSDIVQRWVVIGWLLKSIKNQMVLTHTKRALMYDWFFFDPKSDHLMNLEPSMLLMYHSIPKYVDITSTLVEFLNNEFTVFPQFKEELKRGINSAIKVILDKGVVPTIEPIYSCQLIEPQLREAMKTLFAPYVPADDQVPSPRAANADIPQPPPRPPHRPDEVKRSDSSLRSSQGPNSQVTTQTQTSTAVPVTPVTLAPTATVNTGNSPPAARATTPQKPPLRKSGGPPSAPPSQASTPSPTPNTHTATNTATPAPLNISAAANTSKDVTVTTAVKPQAPAGPTAPVKQAPRTDASNDDWMAAWTSNIQKATREGGLVAPAANASPSPLTSPLLKQVATDPSPPPVPLRKSGEGKFLNAFGNMLTQLKSSQNNIANARNVLKKIISTFLQLCEHFVNDGNENVKSMTSDLAKALLDVMIEEFKESRADQLFSATHNEQTLHILLFDTYVEKKDKSVLYLIKQLRKLEPSIGYRFICYLMERNNVLQSDSHLARFDLFEKTLTAEGEDKALAHYLSQLEKRKTDTSQQKVTALLPYLELLKLSKSNSSSWTPQSIFIGDCKTCAEADVLLFVDLVPHLFRFAEQAQISLKGNVDFIQAIVSSVYPAQLQHLARQLITKEVQLIGDTTKELLQSASQSLSWDSFQQYCYWQLVEAECGHHQDMLEEALPLLLAKINPLTHCEAISGLTSILRNLNPTEAMLGALLMTTLPFAPFVSTLLHSWGYQLVDEQLGVNKINRSYEFLDSIAQILSGLAKGKANTTRTVLRHVTVWRAVDGDTCQTVIFSNKGFKKLFATAITNHKLESEFEVLFKVCASDAAPATSAAVTKKVKEEKDKPVTHKNNNGTSTKKGTTTTANSAANKKKDDKEQKNKNTRKHESLSESSSESESDEDEQVSSESSDSSGAEDFQTKKKVTGVKRRRSPSSESSSDSDDSSEESSEEERPKKKTSAKVEHKRKRRKVDHGT